MESIVDIKIWAREALESSKKFAVVTDATLKEVTGIVAECHKHLDGLKKADSDDAAKVRGWLTSISSRLEKSIQAHTLRVQQTKVDADAAAKRNKEISDRHEAILKKEAGAK